MVQRTIEDTIRASVEDVDSPFYHNGQHRIGNINSQQRKTRRSQQETRPFIAWDGEGINVHGPGTPQCYVLFGNSATGSIENVLGLSTWRCLDFIIEASRANPNAIHVGFAFGYDSNMIVQGLAPATLARLHKNGVVHLRHDDAEYIVTYRKSKWFQVTKLENSTRTSVRIYDIFTFFMCPFLDAYEDWIGQTPDVVVIRGKGKRKTFSLNEFQEIKTYWTVEIQMVRELAEELRRRVYGAGLRITEWHGPGALASYSMREHGIKQHMKRFDDDIRLASRYAYAAGRFETFKIGRTVGPIYGIDLNSAYPSALRRVPSLVEGQWEYSDRRGQREGLIVPFGLYHLKLKQGSLFARQPSPLYHRDRHHELSFPWHTEGWYWSPEARQAVRDGAQVLESWEYRGWETRPFAYIGEMYHQRKQWKRDGIKAERALKLCMNAKTGKAAQRVGWDEKTGRIPGWHQLEWAGWVTSSTRAALYAVMRRIPYEKLIAVETDGFYTTVDPAELGIEASEELGGWSVDIYDEAMYVQSGLAWLRKGDTWTAKRRGLDPESFTTADCEDYLRSLDANTKTWPVFKGQTTRFTTMGMALQSRRVTGERHCVWVTDTREISAGRQGKRVHIAKACDACRNGANAYEQAHDLVISPFSIQDGNPMSYPHSVPWEPESGHAWWRDQEERENLYV